MHDSWGCKLRDCGVSIIYLTPNLFAEVATDNKDKEALEQGKALDAESDRVSERTVKMIAARAASERHN
jgi:hypothetical protein